VRLLADEWWKKNGINGLNVRHIGRCKKTLAAGKWVTVGGGEDGREKSRNHSGDEPFKEPKTVHG